MPLEINTGLLRRPLATIASRNGLGRTNHRVALAEDEQGVSPHQPLHGGFIGQVQGSQITRVGIEGVEGANTGDAQPFGA
jgi:hypothetical protein